MSWLTLRALGSLCKLLHPSQQFEILPDTLGGILIGIGAIFANRALLGVSLFVTSAGLLIGLLGALLES